MSSNKLTRAELLRNLRAMKQPTRLLKFGNSGKPKFRVFRLSQDNRYLEWDSDNKPADQTRVLLTDMREVRFGQRTEKFAKNGRKDLEVLSFSVVYGPKKAVAAASSSSAASFYAVDGESLDLVCKDEREFQIWACTLSEIVAGRVDPSVWSDLNEAAAAPAAGHRQLLSRDSSGLGAGAGAGAGAGGPASGAGGVGGAGGAGAGAGAGVGEMAIHVYSFGWGEWGQCGVGSEIRKETPKLVEPLLGKGVLQLACGWSHTVVLLESGTVLQCGNRLATGLTEDFYMPQPVRALPERLAVSQISCGAFHSAALTEAGELFTWGCGLRGQLGHGNTVDHTEPFIVDKISLVMQVECAAESTIARTSDGNVYTWGSGAHGCLGHSDTQDRLEPTLVANLQGANIALVAGGGHTMFACTEREVYGWGLNNCGQVGLGHHDEVHKPQVIDVLRGMTVRDLKCGGSHTLALAFVPKLDATVVYSWGSNAFGQLGQEKKGVVLKPSLVPLGDNVQVEEVACGDMHSFLRTATGEVYGCGANSYGQLGLGHTMAQATFVSVPSFRDKDKKVQSVVCGGQHTLVMTANENVWVADVEAKECMSCRAGFTFINRKHHCRNCGGIFCNACSSKKIAILRIGITEPVRVCDECYSKLRGR